MDTGGRRIMMCTWDKGEEGAAGGGPAGVTDTPYPWEGCQTGVAPLPLRVGYPVSCLGCRPYGVLSGTEGGGPSPDIPRHTGC